MLTTLNITDPILEHSLPAKLKNGTDLTVTGLVFDHPISKIGDPVYNLIKLMKDEVCWGVVFYPIQMGPSELESKVAEICEDPDRWVAPGFLQKMNN